MSPFFRRLFSAALCCVAAVAAGQGECAGAAPADVVTAFHGVLLDNMKHAKAYGCNGRETRVTHSIEAAFDMPFIAQRVLHRHWADLSADQRSQFVSAFGNMVTSTYASEFNDFSGETFTTLNTDALPNGDQLVHAKLTPGSGDVVNFDYVLRNQDGWRIINVLYDGVSDMATKSAQYQKLFEQKGFDGLLSWIRDQTSKTRASCA